MQISITIYKHVKQISVKNERALNFMKSIRHRALKDISEAVEQLLSPKDTSEAHRVF